MVLKRLPLYLTLSATLALAEPATACGWGPEDWETGPYSFFHPDMSGLESYHPFHFTYDRLYSYGLLEEQVSKDANLPEWEKYFGGKLTRAQVEQVVYTYSADQLQADKTIVPMLKTKHPEAIAYIQYAKRVEPLVVGFDSWEEEESQDPNAAKTLAEEGLEGAKKTMDPFLKLRYAYQALRLFQYYGFHEDAVRTFEEFVRLHEKSGSVIYLWALSNYAGTLRRMDREAEAAYYFSRVFDLCPSRRVQAWYGWRILSDEVWEQTLAMCKTKHEKAVQHFLRALSPEAIAIEDIRAIHRLDPGSELVEMLVIREINKIEHTVFGFDLRQDLPFHTGFRTVGREELYDQIALLASFVDQELRSGTGRDKDFWVLADVYVTYLLGNFDAAQQKLKTAQPTLGPDAGTRAAFLSLIFKLTLIKTPDPATENALFAEAQALKAQLADKNRTHLEHFFDEAFGALYQYHSDKAKTLLAYNAHWSLWEQSKVEDVDAMLAFTSRPMQSQYETYLAARLGDNPKDVLLELKGTRLMAMDSVEDAIKVWETIPPSYWTEPTRNVLLKADPFKGSILDLVNCDEYGCEDNTYNRLGFARKVLELERKAKANPNNSAEIFLQLGHAFYNTSFFGPAWRAMDYARSGASWEYLGLHTSWYDFDPKAFDEHIDLSTAINYYEAAMKTATNPEIAAEACFMAAKCAQHNFTGQLDPNDTEETEFVARIAHRNEYFKILKDQYSRTRFFREAKGSCKYFNYYLSR